MKTLRVLFCGLTAAGVAILLAGCVSAQIGRSFSAANVARLQVGTTTKIQVTELFGPSFVEIDQLAARKRWLRFGDEDTVIILRHMHGYGTLFDSDSRFLQTEFNAAGVLVDYHFTSTFPKEKTPHAAQETNFDLLVARNAIVPGKTSQAQVVPLLGTNYVVLPFNKPGVAQRWHYGYMERSKTEKIKIAGKSIPKFRGKSVDIDFDAGGIVVHVRGESDFPEDLARR